MSLDDYLKRACSDLPPELDVRKLRIGLNGMPGEAGFGYVYAKDVTEATKVYDALMSAHVKLQGTIDALRAAPIPPELDVRKVMVNIIPGPDGEGVEIYAKSVAEVEELLGSLGEQLDEALDKLKRSQPRDIVP